MGALKVEALDMKSKPFTLQRELEAVGEVYGKCTLASPTHSYVGISSLSNV